MQQRNRYFLHEKYAPPNCQRPATQTSPLGRSSWRTLATRSRARINSIQPPRQTTLFLKERGLHEIGDLLREDAIVKSQHQSGGHVVMA